jgi:hypothetical protein
MAAVDLAFAGKMMEEGVLEEADGRHGWSSVAFYVLKDQGKPMVLMPGEDGFNEEARAKYRRVVDLVVNSFITPDVSPMPDLFELAKMNSGYEYYIILDWRDAFHQLVLDLSSRRYTAHGCGGGMKAYSRVLQGLVGASQRMQICSTAIFGHLLNVVCIFDNILIRAHTWEECHRALQEVLDQAVRHGVVMKLKELVVGTASVPFVGHTIGLEGHSMDERLRRGLLTMEWPLSPKVAASFARSVGWMRRYLPKVAAYLAVLLDFEAGKASEAEAGMAFAEVKVLLRDPRFLKDWVNGLTTHLIYDYSATAISAGVEQEHDAGWFPVMYLSRKLTPAEKRSIHEGGGCYSSVGTQAAEAVAMSAGVVFCFYGLGERELVEDLYHGVGA